MNGLTLNQVEVRWDADMPEYYSMPSGASRRTEWSSTVSRPPARLGRSNAAIPLDSVRGVIIRNSQAAEGTTTFLRHRNLTEAGLFGNNDMTKAATAIDPMPSPFASFPSPVAPRAPR